MLADAPDCAALDAGDGFCAGVLYTVQGSTLGGKLIYRQLGALLPDDSGRRFFKGSAEDSRNWQALCAALEGRAADLAELKAGALYAFSPFPGHAGPLAGQAIASRTLKAMQMRSPSPWNGATECSSQLGKSRTSPGLGISECRVIWVKSWFMLARGWGS